MFVREQMRNADGEGPLTQFVLVEKLKLLVLLGFVLNLLFEFGKFKILRRNFRKIFNRCQLQHCRNLVGRDKVRKF